MAPLNEIRVLDLSRLQACPLFGMVLANMGAEVIRVEPPEGAPDRSWGQVGPDGETLLLEFKFQVYWLKIRPLNSSQQFHQ